MKKSALLLCCLLLILLAGCATDHIQAPTPSSTPTPSKTNFWRIVTSTITPTPTITPIVTSTPHYEYVEKCIEILPKMPENAVANGVVVLMKDRKIYLLDMVSQQLTQMSLPNERPYDFDISPNRKLMEINNLVLDDEGTRSDDALVIANARGERLESIPRHDDWVLTHVKWLDDQYLQLFIYPEFIKDFPQLKLDPFTGEQQGIKHSNTGPGWDDFIKNNAPTGIWPGFSAFWEDPTHTLSLYPQPFEHDEEEENCTYHLWNIEEQRLVLSLDSIINIGCFSYYYPQPGWSPDGSQFALGGYAWNNEKEWFDSELFVISREGQVKQMTHLTDINDEFIAAFPSWSPDSRYIAFFLYSYENWRSHLAIFNTETFQLTDYCVPLQPAVGLIHHPPAPLWSPDSKQLLLLQKNPGSGPNQVIWVSPEQGIAAQVAEEVDMMGFVSQPIWGWMASPEE